FLDGGRVTTLRVGPRTDVSLGRPGSGERLELLVDGPAGTATDRDSQPTELPGGAAVPGPPATPTVTVADANRPGGYLRPEPVAGSMAAFPGDPDTGERIVMVTAGVRHLTATQRVSRAARRGPLLIAVAVLAVIAVIASILALTRGGGRKLSNDQLARAAVRI